MLILSRRKDETVVINNNITVTVVEIRDDKVRLGIVSPKEVPVHRKEVFDVVHGTREGPIHDAGKIPQETPDLGEIGDRLGQADPTSVNLTPRQASFVKRIASDLTNKMILGHGAWAPVGRDAVVQAVIDAVEEMKIDLSRIKSLEEMKRLLVDAVKNK